MFHNWWNINGWERNTGQYTYSRQWWAMEGRLDREASARRSTLLGRPLRRYLALSGWREIWATCCKCRRRWLGCISVTLRLLCEVECSPNLPNTEAISNRVIEKLMVEINVGLSYHGLKGRTQVDAFLKLVNLLTQTLWEIISSPLQCRRRMSTRGGSLTHMHFQEMSSVVCQ